MKEVVYVISYYESLVEQWEAWGDTVTQLVDGLSD